MTERPRKNDPRSVYKTFVRDDDDDFVEKETSKARERDAEDGPPYSTVVGGTRRSAFDRGVPKIKHKH